MHKYAYHLAKDNNINHVILQSLRITCSKRIEFMILTNLSIKFLSLQTLKFNCY